MIQTFVVLLVDDEHPDAGIGEHGSRVKEFFSDYQGGSRRWSVIS